MKSRPMAVAGLFYPQQRDKLAAEIQQYLNHADSVVSDSIKAAIAPHAGYVYSGPVAASVYHLLQQQAGQVNRVILLGPAHKVPVLGTVHSQCDAFVTPLGELRVDLDAVSRLEQLGLISGSMMAHRDEHCLEVQLPFIQSVIPQEIPIVPLLVGDESAEQVKRILEAIWQPTDLILISSDLSHYLTYEEAKQKDHQTSDKICHLESNLSGNEACGCRAINGLIEFAKSKHWQASCVDLKNSGDTAGDISRVVGYGAYVFV